MKTALLGIARAFGVFVVGSSLTWLADVSHLQALTHVVILGFPLNLAAVIAMGALGLEHYIEQKTGGALFGAVKTQKVI